MLGMGYKVSGQLDLEQPLYSYITDAYSVEEANRVRPIVKMVSDARALMINTLSVKASSTPARAVLLQYYLMLCELHKYFPFGEDQRGSIMMIRTGRRTTVSIPFHYQESIQGTNASRITSYKLEFEKCGVLFNYGARLSREGVDVKNTSDKGSTVACQLFREAAGVFAYLCNSDDAKAVSNLSADFSIAVTTWISNLMLAQAQTCVFEKAATAANPPPSSPSDAASSTGGASAKPASSPTLSSETVAALAAGCASLYTKVCNAAASQPSLKAVLAQAGFAWDAHCQFQRCCFSGAAHYWYSKSLAAKHDYGTEIAHLLAAKQWTTSAGQYDQLVGAKNEQLLNRKTAFLNIIENRLTEAQRDNDTIYFAQVPATPTPIEPRILVSPIPFDASAMASKLLTEFPGERLGIERLQELRRLVSPETREAAEKFSRKLRLAVDEAVTGADSAVVKIRTELNQLGLPSALDAVLSMASTAEAARTSGKSDKTASDSATTPQVSGITADMRSQIALYRQRGGLEGLNTNLETVKGIAQDANTRTHGLVQPLDREISSLPEMAAQFGERWTLPEGKEECKALRSELTTILSLLSSAENSNQAVAQELKAFSESEGAALLKLTDEQLDQRLREIQKMEQDQRAKQREDVKRAGRAALGIETTDENKDLDIYEILAKRPATQALKASLDALALFVDHQAALCEQARRSCETACESCSSALVNDSGTKGQDAIFGELEAPVQKVITELKNDDQAARLLEDVKQKNTVFAAEVKTATVDPTSASSETKSSSSTSFLQTINEALQTQAKLFANLQEGYNFYTQLMQASIEPLSTRITTYVSKREALRATLIDELQRTLAAFSVPATTPTPAATSYAPPATMAMGYSMAPPPSASSTSNPESQAYRPAPAPPTTGNPSAVAGGYQSPGEAAQFAHMPPPHGFTPAPPGFPPTAPLPPIPHPPANAPNGAAPQYHYQHHPAPSYSNPPSTQGFKGYPGSTHPR